MIAFCQQFSGMAEYVVRNSLGFYAQVFIHFNEYLQYLRVFVIACKIIANNNYIKEASEVKKLINRKAYLDPACCVA
jgi:hypothetical protein